MKSNRVVLLKCRAELKSYAKAAGMPLTELRALMELLEHNQSPPQVLVIGGDDIDEEQSAEQRIDAAMDTVGDAAAAAGLSRAKLRAVLLELMEHNQSPPQVIDTLWFDEVKRWDDLFHIASTPPDVLDARRANEREHRDRMLGRYPGSLGNKRKGR